MHLKLNVYFCVIGFRRCSKNRIFSIFFENFGKSFGFSSASPSGGNQVDGSPPASTYATELQLVAMSTGTWPFDCAGRVFFNFLWIFFQSKKKLRFFLGTSDQCGPACNSQISRSLYNCQNINATNFDKNTFFMKILKISGISQKSFQMI